MIGSLPRLQAPIIVVGPVVGVNGLVVRTIQVILGTMCYIVVDLLFFPVRAKLKLREEIIGSVTAFLKVWKEGLAVFQRRPMVRTNVLTIAEKSCYPKAVRILIDYLSIRKWRMLWMMRLACHLRWEGVQASWRCRKLSCGIDLSKLAHTWRDPRCVKMKALVLSIPSTITSHISPLLLQGY